MRPSSSFGLCAAYVLVGVLPIVAQTIPTEQWQKFSSPTAGFSILMPGKPQESISENHASAFYAEDVKVYSVHVGLDAGSFSAVERIYPQPIDRPNDVSSNIDRFQSFAAGNAHGKVVTQKDVLVEDMPARRVSISLEVNHTLNTMDQMFILKGNRLFQLIVLSGSAGLGAEDIDRFFNSFSVKGEEGDWKRSRSEPNAVVEKSEPEPAQVTTGITAFECPTYPQSARKIRLQGMVRIQVTTDGKKIINLKVTGHPMLAEAAEKNIRTWKFADDAPTNFSVTYLYVNEGEYESDPVYKCRAKLQLPNKVEVSTRW
jgi:hypothetical protein